MKAQRLESGNNQGGTGNGRFFRARWGVHKKKQPQRQWKRTDVAVRPLSCSRQLPPLVWVTKWSWDNFTAFLFIWTPRFIYFFFYTSEYPPSSLSRSPASSSISVWPSLMVLVSQDWVIDSRSGWLARKQPAHWCVAGAALCSDSVMNYWPFNTHSGDSKWGEKERWDEWMPG